jgi:hypothetical protein
VIVPKLSPGQAKDDPDHGFRVCVNALINKCIYIFHEPSIGCFANSACALLESNPSLLECDPSLLESDPALLESDPSLLESDPAQLESDPAQLESDPALLESDPALLESDPLPCWKVTPFPVGK